MAEKDLENHLNCGAFLGIFFPIILLPEPCSTPANKITVPAGLGHEHCEHVSQMTVINSHEKNLLFYKSHITPHLGAASQAEKLSSQQVW